jgi:outer membrane protein TolC
VSDERPGSPDDLARALREAADRLMSPWTAAGPVRFTPPPGLPAPPVTAWARQVQAVLDDLAARRAQVQALRAQLEAFDEQLGNLEASLRPLLEWTRTWAELERAMAEFWSPPRHDKSEKGEGGVSG